MAMKRVFAALGVSAAVLLPSAATAQQYPVPGPPPQVTPPDDFDVLPTDTGTAPEVEGVQIPRAAQPLARTGQDIAELVAIGVASLAAGGILVARGRRSTRLAS